MKRYLTSYDMRELQIEMSMRHHYILTRMAKILNAGEGMEQKEHSFIANGNAKWYEHLGKPFGSF